MNINKLKQLREKTGEGLPICLEALRKNNEDIQASINWINNIKKYNYSELKILESLKSVILTEQKESQNLISVYTLLELMNEYYYRERKISIRHIKKYNEVSKTIDVNNSTIKVYISKYGIELFSTYPPLNLFKFSNIYNEYIISNLTDNIKKELGNENDILNNIFIEINDCPEWMQSILYKIRKRQLNQTKEKVKKLK